MYGSVLSLFVKFSGSEKKKFVKFHIFGKKKTGKYAKIEKLLEKKCGTYGKKLSGKNDPNITTVRSTQVLGILVPRIVRYPYLAPEYQRVHRLRYHGG